MSSHPDARRTPAPADQSSSKAQQSEEQRDLLQRALDRLEASAAAEVAPEHEARLSLRAPYRRMGVPLRVRDPVAKPEERFVVTLDLSAGGIGFLTDAPLAVGLQVELRLPRFGSRGADVVAGKVVRCQPIGGPVHRVGVSFAKPIVPRHYLDPQAVVSVMKRMNERELGS